MRTSSLSEKPDHQQPRRLADWLNPTGTRKIHSLVDKVYKRKNLELAWEKVRANKGAGGIDGQSIEEFEKALDEQLDRLHSELKDDTYSPQPVRQHLIPKAGQPGKYRQLGIPNIYDVYASKLSRTDWSRFSIRYSMTPTTDTGLEDRPRMRYERCGEK